MTVRVRESHPVSAEHGLQTARSWWNADPRTKLALVVVLGFCAVHHSESWWGPPSRACASSHWP